MAPTQKNTTNGPRENYSMDRETLKKQLRHFIRDYADHYNLPKNLTPDQMVSDIFALHASDATIPVLQQHIILMTGGGLRITGRRQVEPAAIATTHTGQAATGQTPSKPGISRRFTPFSDRRPTPQRGHVPTAPAQTGSSKARRFLLKMFSRGKNPASTSANVADATPLPTAGPSRSVPSDPAADPSKEDSGSKPDYVVFPIERFPSPPPDTYSPEPRSPSPEHGVGWTGSSRSSDNTDAPPPAPRISLTYPPSDDLLFPAPSHRAVKGSTLNADPSPYWLETMLIDVERGRDEVENDLKEAQSEVREAVEEVMKAKGELDKEVEEVQGLMHYLAEVVGPDEVERIVKEAQRDALSEGESDGKNNDSGDDNSQSGGADDRISDSSSSSSCSSDAWGGIKDDNDDASGKTSSSSSDDDDGNDDATMSKGKAKQTNNHDPKENPTEQAAPLVATPRLLIAAAPPCIFFGNYNTGVPLPTHSAPILETCGTRRSRTPRSTLPQRYLDRSGTIHSRLPSPTSPPLLSSSRIRKRSIEDVEEEEEEADDERDHAKPSFKRQAKRARHKADAAHTTASTMIPSITTLLPSATSSSRKRTRSKSPSSGSNSDSEREVENSIIVGLPNGFSPLTPGHYRAQDARDARRRKRARVDSGSYDKGADVEEGDSESIPLYVSSEDGDTADGPSIQSQSQPFHTHQPQSQSQPSQSQSRPRTRYVAKPHPFGGREPAMLFINGRDIVPGIIESNRQHFYADLEKDWRNHTNAPEGAIPPWVVPDAEGNGVDRDQEDEDEEGGVSDDDVRPVAWNDYEVNEEEEDVEMGEDEVSEDELEDVVGDVGNLAEENDHGESGRRSDVVRDGFLSAWFADPSSLLHQNTRHRSQPHPHSAQTQSQASTSQSHTQSRPYSSQSQSQSQAGPSQPRRRARPLTRARERIRINGAGQYETYFYDETPEYRARLQREKKMFEEWRNYRPEPDDYPWQQVLSKIRQLSETAPPVLWEDDIDDPSDSG